MSCRGHVWLRIGGSRKEFWFECWFCGETLTKRRGTDVRVLAELERRRVSAGNAGAEREGGERG